MSLSDKDLEMLEIFADPVKWIEYETGIKPRWYQAEILRSPSKRIVLRAARRLGKSYTIAIHMLWHAFTTKNAVCLYVAPSEAQISTQFSDVGKVIKMGKGLEASVVSITKSPYIITFGNGSIIKGVTAGTKSGGKGFALRGQKATWLYVDEMDYLGEDDWNSIYPIVLEAPKRIGVTVSSTPTGKRSIFYNMCFIPGTQITMGDGSQKSIESVQADEYVLSHTGNKRRVQTKFAHDYNGRLYNIKTEKIDTTISSTEEHPFYVYRNGKYEWVKARKLDKDDVLLVPIPKEKVQSDSSLDEMELLGYFFGSGSILKHEQDIRYPIDEEYLRYGVRFNVKHIDVSDRIKELVDALYGIKEVNRNEKDMTVDVYDVRLANAMHAYDYAVIPDWISMAPVEKVKAFLKGYLSSNSYINSEFFCTAKTFNTSQIISMLGTLNVFPRMNSREERVSNEIRIDKKDILEKLNDLIIYDWDRYNVKRRSSDKVIKDGYMHVKIKSIKITHYIGPVFNMQVEEDNSYIANFVAVHNCTNKSLGWTQFHHPIMVHPEWSPDMEKELRQIFSSEIAWEHEELAEFGTEVSGVFSKVHLDRSRKEYDYIEFPFYPAIRTMGVDWDKYGAETQIVVMEYVPELDKFRVLNRIAIPKGEFTLDNGVEKIKELNERYMPQVIYVDRGFGEHQVETLHKYGLDHPETGLAKKVKGIAFGSSIEVRDPFTKQMTKKPIKPFMVDQFSIQLERDRIILSENDVDLWRDLENYNIVRWSSQGNPIFTSQNEHTIDATMLAMTAFILDVPELSNTMYPISVARQMAHATVAQFDPLKDLFDDKTQERDYIDKDSQRYVKVPLGSKPGSRRGSRQPGWSRGKSESNYSRKKW